MRGEQGEPNEVVLAAAAVGKQLAVAGWIVGLPARADLSEISGATRATNAVRKDASITVTMFVPPGAARRRRVRRR